MIDAIKNDNLNNSFKQISFKGGKIGFVKKCAQKTLKSVCTLDSNDVFVKTTETKIEKFIKELKNIVQKKEDLPVVKKPVIAPAKGSDLSRISELSSLKEKAKECGCMELFDKAEKAIADAEKNMSEITGYWSQSYLTTVDNSITDLKYGISKSKSSHNYFEEDSKVLSFGNELLDKDVPDNLLDNLKESLETPSLQASVHETLNDLNNINTDVSDLPQIADIPKVEDLPDFTDVKEFVQDLYADIGEFLNEAWQTIKGEFVG